MGDYWKESVALADKRRPCYCIETEVLSAILTLYRCLPCVHQCAILKFSYQFSSSWLSFAQFLVVPCLFSNIFFLLITFCILFVKHNHLSCYFFKASLGFRCFILMDYFLCPPCLTKVLLHQSVFFSCSLQN